ncbi:MFS transporter [Comamonas testosteroni TK102]|uniref:MFS transporter n=1 Tax=Comamonas testosteroni TK102 TaxID=1392005 RepID=A0A076PXF5_COMTE|nr:MULTISPECIES: MFS transporter [Comamonas]AIJ48032.1 MFS transporter [Comamonas testosteroni TK102]MPS90574.1 MFS transporter [Comamonas sp.]
MSSPVPPCVPQASTVAPLRDPAFVNFVLARMLAMFAQQMQAVVVAWQVYDITREPLSLAYVGLAQFLPMAGLLIPAGDLSDRMSRKRLLGISWLVAAVCSGLLWLLAESGAHDVHWIYAVLVLFGCSRAFSGPALQSLLPQIVAREQLAKALATNSMLMRISAIAAPVLGGLLYALGGGVLTYAVCGIALILGAVLLSQVPVRFASPRIGIDGQTTMWQRFAEGLHFMRTRPIILGTISLDLFAVLLGGVVALLPVYAHEVLQVGPQGLGLLRSSMAAGEVCMGLWLASRPINRRVGKVMFAAVAVFGLANLVFALSHWFVLSMLALAVAGAADMVSVYIRGALVQFSTPDHMRGRVNAVNMLFIGSSNELGEFRAGSSASWFGAVPAAILGSLCTLGVVGGWMTLFKPLRDVDRLEDAARVSGVAGPAAT